MIVKLQGGLGNQMFQYAYGISDAARRGVEIYFDRSGILPPREYALEPFHLNIRFQDHSPDAESGYWQSEKWFDAHKVFQAFRDPSPLRQRIDLCAVHIRLTDNLSARALAFHGNLLDTDYYQRAMEYVRERVPNVHFVVFSDDLNWCWENLQWTRTKIVNPWTPAPPHEHIWAMARCGSQIIANSSFSWWGAWLGPQGLVVAPTRWFVVPVEGAEDIVPDRWTRL